MHALLWIIILIILYGSLYPFDFHWADLSQISWLDWSTQIQQKTTNGDILSNILTFIPLGYFAFFTDYFSKHPPFKRIALILSSGFIFAYSLQIVQFFLPSRIATAADAITNFLGLIIGVALACSVYYSLKSKPEIKQHWSETFSIPLLLVACWLVYCCFPFFPHTQLSLIFDDLKPIWSSEIMGWHEWLFKSVFWACFYHLLMINPWKKMALKHALILSGGIIAIKALVAHNFVDSSLLLSMISGLVITISVPQKRHHSTLFTLIIVALILKNFFPWQQKATLSEFNWIPFSSYLTGSMWMNSKVFLENIFSFGCLIYYANHLFSKRYLATLICFCLLFLVELLQVALSFGRADITDPILALLIAYTYSQMMQLKICN